jgi:hypothetical protein
VLHPNRGTFSSPTGRYQTGAPHYEVIVQEDLPPGFGDLLETLDHEIKRSLFVIHLVGDLAGFVPELAQLRKLRSRHPEAGDRGSRLYKRHKK